MARTLASKSMLIFVLMPRGLAPRLFTLDGKNNEVPSHRLSGADFGQLAVASENLVYRAE